MSSISFMILRKLNEMADSLEDIKKEIRENYLIVLYHLILIYLYPESDLFNHWSKEVRAGIFNLSKFKRSNKLPTRKQLNNWVVDTIMEMIEDHIEVHVEDAIRKELPEEHKYDRHIDIPEYNKQALIQYCQEYFDWLFNKLTNVGIVSIIEVQDEVKLLLNKYRI